jgi:cyclophilin family peptidyl-prolyl cis-trans isomerase
MKNPFKLPKKKYSQRNSSLKGLLGMFLFLATLAGTASGGENTAPHPRVTLETSNGRIVLELYPEKAFFTVKNFLGYAASGFYNGTVFHRVIPGFMIQGGGFTKDMTSKKTEVPIKNEADNGLSNDRGTIAMARTRDPHSASSQFFINTVNNHFLNHKSKTLSGWGYAVFGKVVEGMDVVDAISNVKTTTRGRFRNVPEMPVEIVKVLSEVREPKGIRAE